MSDLLVLFLSIFLVQFLIPVYDVGIENQIVSHIPEISLGNAFITGTIADNARENFTTFPPMTIPRTPDSKTAVVRYSNKNLPENIRSYVDFIDFQITTEVKGEVYI